MNDAPALILVADDDPRIVNLVTLTLEKAGLGVVSANDGAGVFEILKSRTPDLFLLDVEMPGLDGLELCRRLKSDETTQRIPVIFLTARDQTDDILRGFEAGAADYITKPLTRPVLLARVNTHLRLYRSMMELERLRLLALDANPLSGLPGNNSLADAVTRAITGPAESTLLYCDIDNFKAFNDHYGFARGDEAILFTAGIIRAAVDGICGPGSFIGHVGGDDFAAIVKAECSREAAAEIVKRFDAGVRALYDAKDLEAGGFRAENRRGESQFFPVMSISIGGADIGGGRFSHYLEAANACAEMKRFAKGVQGSAVRFDRRV